jgi:hypothetical protein
MNLTGKDVHRAFVAAFPYLAPNWYILPDTSKEGYERIAEELNKLIEERIEHSSTEEKQSSPGRGKHV